MGLPDSDANARLRAAVIAARAQSMPKDNIERAIDKAVWRRRRQLRGDPLRGFRPGRGGDHRRGATDNRNRTATNVRTAFSKNGGNLGASGSVSHGFDGLG